MSLAGNFSRGGSSGGSSRGGMKIISAAGGNQKSALEVEEEQRVARRMELLGRDLPEFTSANFTAALDLARTQNEDDEMMGAAWGAMSAVHVDQTLKRVQALGKDEQRGVAAMMNPINRDALVRNGWKIPALEETKASGGLFRRIVNTGLALSPVSAPFLDEDDELIGADAAKGTLGAGAKAAGWGLGLPGIKQGLAAMDWVAEESTHPTRVLPIMQSGKDLLEETGMSAEQLEAQTGIQAFASQGDLGGGRMGSSFEALNLADQIIRNPSDLWKAAQTWSEIGHEGDNDILPQIQYQVYNDLEENFPGNGKDMLRWAKAMAGGETVEDLAEAEGLEGDQAAQFVQQVGLLTKDPRFTAALSKLTGGQVSVGRTMARRIWDDPTMDTREGAAKYVSGVGDLTFSIVADPTIVLGKVTKVAKAVRWGAKAGEGFDDLNRMQKGVRILTQAEERGVDAEAAIKLARDMGDLKGGRKWTASAVREAEAAAAPAKAVQKAFQTGNFAELIRKYPGFINSVEDLRRYDTNLRQLGEKGFAEDAAQVFEFYKEAAGYRNRVNMATPGSLKFDMKVFGHDGGGHLVIPHMTGTQRVLLNAKEGVSRVAFGELDEIPQAARDEMKASFDEAAADMARAKGVPEEEILEAADSMEVDRWTGHYQKRQPSYIQDKLFQLYQLGAKKVTRANYIPLEGPASLQQFDSLANSLGMLAGTNKLTIAARINRFAVGTIAEKHLLLNEMFQEMFEAGGMAKTKEGRKFFEEHIAKENHIFGWSDEISLVTKNAQRGAARIIARQAVGEHQLANALSVPSMREIVIAARKTGGLRRVTGQVRKSYLEAGMKNIWTPLSLFRFALPLRGGADEAIQEVGRNGLHGYLKSAAYTKWAGVNKWYFDETGKLVNETSHGAVRPFQTFTRFWANVAGGSDRAIREAAEKKLAQTPEFIKADAQSRVAMIMAEATPLGKDGGRRNLAFVPRSMRAVHEGAVLAAMRSSEAIHKLAGQSNVTRHVWREKLLDISPKTIRNRKILSVHPSAQREQAEVIGSVVHGLRDGGIAPELALVSGQETASGWRALPIRLDYSNYEWVGHDDISGMMLNMGHYMQQLARPESSARAGIQELAHLVPVRVLDEVSAKFGVQGLDGLREVRDLVAEDETVRKHLAHAVNSEADAASIRASLKENGVELGTDSPIIKHWDTLSPEAKRFISDDRLFSDRLTDNMQVAIDRATNGIYNQLRRLDNQGNLRSLIRAQVIDGLLVAEPLKQFHTRVYAPMLDRRSAEDIVRLFQDEDMASTFAERLEFHLKERGLFGEMKALWDGAPPAQGGYDLATWMASLKASLAQGNSSYIPASMAGSSNYAAAEAMRDALADVIPDKMLKPTVGYYDYANDLMDRPGGMKRLSQSTVGMDPTHAAKMRAIDPEAVVRQIHVRLADGKERWVGEQELASIGRIARMDEVDVKRSFSNKRLIETDRSRTVRFNSTLVDNDYKDGMKFLRGTAGDYKRTKAGWTWADPEAEANAEKLAGIFDALGFEENSGLTLDDMIGLYRSNNNAPIPRKGQLEDEELWDDFVEIANAAQRTPGGRVVEEWTDDVTKAQSEMAKTALDELGVDLDALNLKRAQYKRLLVEREKAHVALDPGGFGRAKVVSRATIEREKDALAIAFQRAGIDTPVSDQLRERLTVAIGKEKEDYTVLREIYGTGTVEDVAVRSAAQTIMSDLSQVFIGARSKEPLHAVIGPLLRDEFELDTLIRGVDIKDLPGKGAFGPARIIGEEGDWNKTIRRFFDDGVQPVASAISRTPMFNRHFDTAMDQFQHVYDSFIHQGLDTEAKAVMAKAGIDPDDFEDVNDLLVSQIRNDKDFGLGATDPITVYVRKLNEKDFDGARQALDEVLGRPSGLSEEEITTLGRWHANRATAREMQVDIAQRRASDMVMPYVDDHRLRSNLQEFLGPVFIPFFYAEEQFLRRFARGLYETPYMLRKGQLLMNGLRNMGIVRDAEGPQGGEIVVIPGSELFTSVLASVAEPVFGKAAAQVLDQPLSFSTNFVMPGWNTEQSRWGWGPLIGVSSDALLQRFPDAEWRSDAYYRPWWQTMVPGPVAGAYRAFLMEGDPAQIVTAEAMAISMMEANGHGLAPDATASEKESYLADVRQATRVIGVMRYLTGQLSLTSMQPYNPEAVFRQEFSDLLAEGIPHAEAVDIFVATHGPEGLAEKIFKYEEGSILEAIREGKTDMVAIDTTGLTDEEFAQMEQSRRENIARTMGITQNETGAPLPVNEEAYRFIADNREMFRDDPYGSVWLLPQDDGDSEFDRRAWNEQLSLDLRTRKTPQEMLDQIAVAQASETYFVKKDKHDAVRRNLVDRRDAALGPERAALQEEISMEDDRWKLEKDVYFNQHPVFAESFSPEAKQRRQKAIEQLEWKTAAGIGGEQGEVIGGLLAEYRAFLDGDGSDIMVGDQVVRNHGYTVASKDTSKFGKELKEEILHRHFTRMWTYVQDNPKAAPFWNSVIRPELPDQADTIETKLTQGG